MQASQKTAALFGTRNPERSKRLVPPQHREQMASVTPWTTPGRGAGRGTTAYRGTSGTVSGMSSTYPYHKSSGSGSGSGYGSSYGSGYGPSYGPSSRTTMGNTTYYGGTTMWVPTNVRDGPPSGKLEEEAEQKRKEYETLGTCGLANLGNTCYMNATLQ